MNPPPPMLPAAGYVTASANAVATAASTALPPALRTDTPAADASGQTETTTPLPKLLGSSPASARGDKRLTVIRTRARTGNARRFIGESREGAGLQGLSRKPVWPPTGFYRG